MKEVKLSKVGNSLGIRLPKEALDRYQIKEGDKLFVKETAVGFEITRFDPETMGDMEMVREIMSDYKHTLKKLAE